MEIVDNGVDYKSAPADYAELFRIYFPIVVPLVRMHGIDDKNKEDVASEILKRFFERGFLEEFNPNLKFMYDGVERPANFKNFLTQFAKLYVKGLRDKQYRLKSHEVLIFDMPVHAPQPGDGVQGGTWGEIYGGQAPSHEDAVIDALDAADLVAQARAYLETVPRRSQLDTCDLVALFDEVVRQVDQIGEPDMAGLRRHFHVSSTAMHSWMWRLREELAKFLDRPLPPKRSRKR